MPSTKPRSYRVTGGAPLVGSVSVPGAKNAATKQLVATLLSEEPVTLTNVPKIGDVEVTIDIIRDLGAKVTWKGSSVTVDPSGLKTPVVSATFSSKNRIPILLAGPLIHRFGEAVIPSLGGCTIGGRPVDFHFQALEKMGAEIIDGDGAHILRATKLRGAVIELDYPSVGATENVLLSAVKAEGITIIKNAAVEPEIMDLAVLLQSMGAIVSLEVNRTWVVQGVAKLHGTTHRVIPDRIVAASFGVAAALTGGDVFVKDARQVDMITFLNALRRVGVRFDIQEDGIRFCAPEKKQKLQPISLETEVHPGFMTDWQQPFVMLLTQADGVSVVHETVFENRFGYTEALVKMGARIQLHRECFGSKPCRFVNRNYLHSAVIVGPTPLKAADIVIPDLRAGFSYVIAALIAKGTSNLTGVELIERGYEDIIGKLKGLGAKIAVKG
jgi:UDP-N-acetylglucosamine 1-carboxyvinyltransferase